ncbi:MAG TPA: thioesterase family protein [Nitriliruptoraceae bacterium]|nr:thioesterase family protein [Nitriliruptoraceae bacterium]
MADEAYFSTTDGTWFVPSDLARGPWDPDACHGGPPTALLIRAIEHLGLAHRLTRLTVALHRPVPMAGFGVRATTDHAGRTAATATATIEDGNGRRCVTANALLITPEALRTPSAPIDAPVFADAVPGAFTVRSDRHDGLRFFSHSTDVRHQPGAGDWHPTDLGPATMWMRTVPIVAGEEPSPLQKLGPLADCANGISFNAPVEEVSCVNPDLTLTLLREPVGDWFASRAATHSGNDGIGFSDAHLFDTEGLVGRVTQSLVLRAV